MSSENVEVVREFEDALYLGPQSDSNPNESSDFLAVSALIEPRAVFRPPASLPHGGDWTGPDGFEEMCRKYDQAWVMLKRPKITYRDAGDIVLVHASYELEARRTGNRVPVDMVELITVDDGKIVELIPYYRDTVTQAIAVGTVSARSVPAPAGSPESSVGGLRAEEMSADKIEVVRQFEETLASSREAKESSGVGNFDSALPMVDDTCVFRPPASLPHGGDWVGHEGFAGMCKAYGEAWIMIQGPVRTYRDAGDIVLMHAKYLLESHKTGERVPVDMVELITVLDGKIVELIPYYLDTVSHAEAAGTVAPVQ